jgi:extracellular factor (EF) 3-hydroxypalmitic acid methyl ester biosynthesis protein
MNNELPYQDGNFNDSLVRFRTSQGLDSQGTLLRVTRHQAVFEAHSAAEMLRVSEVLDDFKILINSELVYSGKGVISNLVSTGPTLVCETRLDDVWVDLDRLCASLSSAGLRLEFESFLRQWQKHFHIGQEYRLFVSELHSFFHDLRLWLEHVELGIRSRPSGDGQQFERQVAQQLGESTFSIFRNYAERFEALCADLDPEKVPAHQAYIRRQMHPLLLCSPFVYRTFSKPLGYAGDYEVVNMIMRDPFEGASLFAKIVNYCFLNQKVGVAHQNRVKYLVDRLVEEGLRTARAGRGLRVLSLGCGPAVEVQQFLAHGSLASNATFELVDFNDETLQHAHQALVGASQKYGVRCPAVRLTKKSVHHIVKEAAKSTQSQPDVLYDFVYCAGLFDYLTSQVCRRLMEVMFDRLAPGGLLIATNVAPSNPLRYGMEHLLDWMLVYRSATELGALGPERAAPEVSVKSDLTGVNIWAELRKSANG